MDSPWRLLRLTPQEIETEFQALDRRRQHQLQQADLSAWLAGRYVLMAVHAPKKFPRSPDGIRLPKEEMPPEGMMRVFKTIAARREDKHGNC